jgi:tripartite-type tricarboxylate transporter receptor subunit TctC
MFKNLLSAAVAASVAVLPSIAAAASYPERPIRIIVPYPAGGTTDQMARVIQPTLAELLKQPVIVENRAGAGGAIGTQAVVSAEPDGYTLVFGNSGPNAILPMIRKLAFDPVKDLRPISVVAVVPLILAVPADSPAKSLDQFLELAKKEGAKMNYGSVGNGSLSHLAGEFFKHLTNTQMVHVPYKGGAPMMTAFATGDIQLAFVTGLDAAAMHSAGKIRYLGLASEKAMDVAPGLPAIGEKVPGFRAAAWFGLLAPAATPAPIVKQLNDAIRQAVARP